MSFIFNALYTILQTSVAAASIAGLFLLINQAAFKAKVIPEGSAIITPRDLAYAINIDNTNDILIELLKLKGYIDNKVNVNKTSRSWIELSSQLQTCIKQLTLTLNNTTEPPVSRKKILQIIAAQSHKITHNLFTYYTIDGPLPVISPKTFTQRLKEYKQIYNNRNAGKGCYTDAQIEANIVRTSILNILNGSFQTNDDLQEVVSFMQLKTTTFINSISEGNVTQYDLLKSSCEQFIGDLTAAREIMLIESRINSLTDLINAHMTVIKEKFQASTQASFIYI